MRTKNQICRRTLLFVGMLTLVISAWSQSIIKGRIVDVDSNPIEFASVKLLSKDSVLIKGTTTNHEGFFVIKSAVGENYVFRISALGYSAKSIALMPLESITDLGEIKLQVSDVKLNEVRVSSSSIIQKPDKILIIPSKISLRNAYTPFDLLFNMGIPMLCISPISKELSVNGGAVQLRINGIKSTTEEVASLLPKDIIRVEMVQNPGARYGENILGAVLDIIVNNREIGGLINLQSTNSPNVLFGENNFSAKYNSGKAQWGVNYYLGYRGVKSNRTDKSEKFYLSNHEVVRLQQGLNDRSSWSDQNFDLSYNLSVPEKYVFNAVLKNNLFSAPFQNESNRLFNGSDMDNYILSKTIRDTYKYTPSLDLYFQRQLPKQQTLTVNLVSAIINSENNREYEENTVSGATISDIRSNIVGHKVSLIGEAIYDKRIKTVVFSAGLRHQQMFSENRYSGTIPVNSQMMQIRSSLFTEWQGAVGKINYGLSVGLTRSFFVENNLSHEYYTFSPILRLAFSPHKNGYISYRFNTEPKLPSQALLSNVEQAIDTLQILRGNPLLKPYNSYNSSMSYSYNVGKVIMLFNVNHSYQKNCIMESIFEENGKIVTMDENQKSFHSLEVFPSIIFRGIKLFDRDQFLTVSLEGGQAFYQSKGLNYTHLYRNFFYNLQFMMSYKKFALLGQFSKNKNILLGETIFKGENQTALMATWTHNRLQVGLGVMFPFTNNYRTGKQRLSSVAPYTSWSYTKEMGQMLAIRLNYNFEFGKHQKANDKRMNNKDNDSGILKIDEY